MKQVLSALLAITVLCITDTYAATALYFFSQPSDVTGQGEERTFSVDTGYTITPSVLDNSVSFEISNSIEFWNLDLAPSSTLTDFFTVGAYENSLKSSTPTNPQLRFVGPFGPGFNDELFGRFDILETNVIYGDNADVMSFAIDFEQHVNGAEAALFGQLRFNSEIPIIPNPVPLPAALLVFVSGLVLLMPALRRKRKLII